MKGFLDLRILWILTIRNTFFTWMLAEKIITKLPAVVLPGVEWHWISTIDFSLGLWSQKIWLRKNVVEMWSPRDLTPVWWFPRLTTRHSDLFFRSTVRLYFFSFHHPSEPSFWTRCITRKLRYIPQSLWPVSWSLGVSKTRNRTGMGSNFQMRSFSW